MTNNKKPPLKKGVGGIKVGRIYQVNHKNKGKFQLKVTRLDSSRMITGTITKGKVGTPPMPIGTTLTIDLTLAVLKEVKKKKILPAKQNKKGGNNGRQRH